MLSTPLFNFTVGTFTSAINDRSLNYLLFNLHLVW
jgi:hypothetical protein